MKDLIIKEIKHLLFILALIVIADLALILMDQFYGAEKGVVFGYNLSKLIWVSNVFAIFFTFSGLVLHFAINRSLVVRKYTKNILLSLSVILFILFLIEIILYASSKKELIKLYEFHGKSLFKGDPALGYVVNKNVKASYIKILVNSSKQKSKRVDFIFNTTITTDSLGYRLIDIKNMQLRKKYALFFGCSFTFGLGVENDETIPYYFAKNDTNFCSYNYAITGYGPQSMLALLEHTNLQKSVKQNSGIGLYIYMDSHPFRAIGDMRTYTTFGHDLPYYDYMNDSIHDYGLFKNDRFLISGIYTVLSKSNFVKRFNLNFPPRIKPKHFILTCDIIYKSYLEYKKQFGNDNFYVIIYPGSHEIQRYLKKYNIKVIDLTNLFDVNDKKYYLSGYDKHPSAYANKVLSEKIIEVLKN